MKVKFINTGKGGQVGSLEVSAKHLDKEDGSKQYVMFPIDTLFDWYPLNSHYTYNYSERQDLYYLRVMTEGLLIPRYNLANNKGAKLQSRSSLKRSMQVGEPIWWNPQVAEHNKEVFAFAKSMGMTTPEEAYTKEDVACNKETFQKALDALYKSATERYFMVSGNTDSYDKEDILYYEGVPYAQYTPNSTSTLIGTDDDKRAENVLAHSTEEEIELYYRLGEVYTMICLMQKLANLKG